MKKDSQYVGWTGIGLKLFQYTPDTLVETEESKEIDRLVKIYTDLANPTGWF